MIDLKDNTIEDLDDCLSKSAIQSAKEILHICHIEKRNKGVT